MTHPLTLIGHVPLPAHAGSGGFDHAAVHAATGHVYVAHTANSAVDVFDPATRKHLYSIPGLAAVAGALVSDESQLVFTSNRGENTIGVFAPGPESESDQDRRRRAAQRPRLRRQAAPGARRQCRRSGGAAFLHALDGRSRRARHALVDRGAGPHPLDGVRCRRRGLLRQHHAALADRRRRCAPARPRRAHHARPGRRRARPRLRSRDAPPVLRLRRGRAGHARCRHRQGAGREASSAACPTSSGSTPSAGSSMSRSAIPAWSTCSTPPR